MQIFRRFLIAFVFLAGVAIGTEAISAKTPIMTTQVYALASRGDLAALKRMSSHLNKTDYMGRTALCWAVKKKNYRAYHTLTRAGANRKHKCVRQFTSDEIREFNQGYREWAYTGGLQNTQVGEAAEQAETGLSTPAKVGIGVGAVALIGGGIALAAGGGGGSSSKGDGGGGSAPATCDGYDLSGCPSGGICDECSTGIKTVYRMTGCRSGYIREGNTCIADETSSCPANMYGHGNSCSSCPAHSTSAAGSISIDDCLCQTGYTKVANICIANSSGTSYATTPSTFTSDNHYITTGTMMTIKAANAYAKFIRVKDDGTYDYSALKEVKVVVADSVGEQNYGSYPVVTHSAINYAKTTDGSRDYLYPTAGVTNIYSSTANDAFYHGVAVASVIAAKWNSTNNYWGVAPNASVYAVSFRVDTGPLYQVAFEKGARVVNQSYTLTSGFDTTRTTRYSSGYTLSSALDSLSYWYYSTDDSLFQAAKHNAVIVKSAGNYYDMSGPTFDNAMGAGKKTWTENGKTYSLKNLFITAVAATSKVSGNTLQDYSHYCGWAQSWCLTAPVGTRVASINATVAGSGSNYYVKSYTEISSTFSGTSNAAPVISGGVAFLMGAYPYLTSQQVVEILFRSANKTVFSGWDNDGTWTDSFGNTYRTSSKYGHGMMDLDAATEPLGSLALATDQGNDATMGDLTSISKIPVGETHLLFPGTVYTNEDLPQTIMGLDDYNRPFSVSTAEIVSHPRHSDRAWRRSFKSFMSRDRRTKTDPTAKLSFEFASSVTNDNLAGLGVLDMTYRTGDESTLQFSYRSDVLGEEKYFDRVLSNPFMDMTDSYALMQQIRLTPKLSFGMGASLGKNGFYEAEEENDDLNRSMYAFVSDVGYQITPKLALRVTGGMVMEKDAILGINGTGAFQTQNGRTYFTGAMLDYHPVPAVGLSASYYLGRTEGYKSDSLMSFSDITSDSFALKANYSIMERDNIGLLFYAPLRVREGEGRFRLPVGRDSYTDTVYYDDVKLGLKPKAREYDVGLYYTTEKKNYDWRAEFMTRFHPDHQDGIRPDYRVLFGWAWKY